LIQSEEIDEEEHVVFSYHIETLNDLMYWVNKDVIAVKSMLIEIRKENVKLNNFYNVIVNERARYEIEYERLKKTSRRTREWKREIIRCVCRISIRCISKSRRFCFRDDND
jgi:hypothetical protein